MICAKQNSKFKLYICLFFALTLCCLFGVNYCNPTYQRNTVESKFTINVNTIILTAQSKSMGAIYINESLLLQSNHDCLLWCWEIPNCNVAVFEQMTNNNCFLFDCGSPADFRCTFTTHNFYTSSIKNTQHSFDLKQWVNEAKSKIETTSMSPITPARAVPSTAASPTPKTEENFKKPENICSRYQFQCSNSTECIAIYNVCDGIPQCPNGSDESLELDCPNKGSTKTTEKASVLKIPPTQPPVVKQPVATKSPPNLIDQSKVLSKPIIPHRIIPPQETNEKPHHSLQKDTNYKTEDKVVWQEGYGGTSQQSSNDYEGSDSLRSPFAHKHSKFMAANSRYPPKWSSEDYDQRYNQQPGFDQQYDNSHQKVNEGKSYYPDYDRTLYDTYHQEDSPYWNEAERLRGSTSYQNAAEYLQPNRPASKTNRESLYSQRQRLKSEDVINPYAEQEPQDRRVVHKQHRISPEENYQVMRPQIQQYQDMPRSDYRLQYPVTKQNVEITQGRNLPGKGLFSSEDAIRESLAKQEQDLMSNKQPLHIYEPIVQFPTSAPTTPPIQRSSPTSGNQREVDVKSTPAPRMKEHKQQPSMAKMSATELFQSQSIHNRESNNAILALILGLFVTALLVVLVGCRLKSLKRKSGRRGRTLTHDADYLVNGLYL